MPYVVMGLELLVFALHMQFTEIKYVKVSLTGNYLQFSRATLTAGISPPSSFFKQLNSDISFKTISVLQKLTRAGFVALLGEPRKGKKILLTSDFLDHVCMCSHVCLQAHACN